MLNVWGSVSHAVKPNINAFLLSSGRPATWMGVCRWLLVIFSAKFCIRFLSPLSAFISYFTLSTILLTVLYFSIPNSVCYGFTPSPYEEKRVVWSGLPEDLFPTPTTIHHVIPRIWILAFYSTRHGAREATNKARVKGRHDSLPHRITNSQT